MKIAKRTIAFFLLAAMILAMMPAAYAAEVDESTPPEDGENTGESPPIEETTQPPDSEENTDTQNSTTEESSEESSATESVPEESEEAQEEIDPAHMKEPLEVITSLWDRLKEKLFSSSGASTMALDTRATISSVGNMCVQGEYKVTLSYRLKDGVSRSCYIQGITWHYVDSNTNPALCLEPNKECPYGVGGMYAEDIVLSTKGSTTAGGKAWDALSDDQHRAIALIALYATPAGFWDSAGMNGGNLLNPTNPNQACFCAAQIMTWEIVTGLRSTTPPYQQLDSKLYNAYDDKGVVSTYYNYLSEKLANHDADAYKYEELPSPEESEYKLAYGVSSKQTLFYVTNRVLREPEPEPDPTGNLTIKKTTEDNKNLAGWQFGLYYNSSCTNLAVGLFSSNANGRISVEGLDVGTYYVKEIGHTNSAVNALYYCNSTNPQKVTIRDGETSTVTFSNKLNLGSVKIVKNTNTGENRQGWKIGLYTDSACTKPISGSPFTTGSDGTVTVSSLSPGTLYAKELPSDDPFWECDTSVKTVTVAPNTTVTVTFSNAHHGEIEIHKTTSTGNHLGGWKFTVTDGNGKTVGEYTTDDTGIAHVSNLEPGQYKVKEKPVSDPYWSIETVLHTVTVTAGQTATDTWLNKELGLGKLRKSTSTGKNINGWKITLYSDEECTKSIATYTTGQDGTVSVYMEPGVYYAKETGDVNDWFSSPYWICDTDVHKLEIKPHAETEIIFQNTACGRLLITKTMATDGSVEGWQFQIKDASGAVIEGSPFTTDSTGKIYVDQLLPGNYTVEELIPENSMYFCATDSIVPVSIKVFETAAAAFTNALRPGSIHLQKNDIMGQPLAGAEFRLEWSEDGNNWEAVRYSDSPYVIKGGCSNSALVKGCLTSGESGYLEWNNLHPNLKYRLTETKAPNGFNKLSSAAFEGTVTDMEDYTVSIRVTNSRIFTLPDTGSTSLQTLNIMSMLAMAMGIAISAYCLHKKGREE